MISVFSVVNFRIFFFVQGGPKAMETVVGRVVGIDPGLNVTGYAVVDPSSKGPYVVEAGVIRPRGGTSITDCHPRFSTRS